MIKKNTRHIFFWLFVVILLLNFHLRGVTAFDEGQMLNSAIKIIDGQLPYRDFQFFYTPGSVFSIAFIFKLFGASILSERVFAAVITLGSSFLTYKIVRFYSKSTRMAYFSVLVFIFWGPAVISFIWPIVLCLFLGLLNTYLFLHFNKNHAKYLFYAGIVASVTVLFKQNFGLALIVSNIFLFIFLPLLRNKKNFLSYLTGIVLPIIIFFVYLIISNSTLIFFEEMNFIMFEKILKEGMLATPFIYEGGFVTKTARLLFYLLPLIISLVTIKINYKKDRKAFILIFFPLTFYIAGIRPTTDFIHLAPLITLLPLPLSATYRYFKFAPLILVLLIFLGLYSAIFRGYYRWEAPIFTNNNFYGGKANIFVDAKHKIVFEAIVPQLKNSNSDYIFVYHYSPIFYFLSDKKNPTRWDNLPPEIFTDEVQREIIEDIKRTNVDTILVDKAIDPKSEFGVFVLNNFTETLQLSENKLYKKTAE